MSSKKVAGTTECTSIAGHFDSHGSATVQYIQYHPMMQHVQGYTGSHWTPLLGGYLIRIAPAAATATANKSSMKNVPILLVILMALAMRKYNAERITHRRRFMAFLKAIKRHHWVSTCSDSINRTCLPLFFVMFFHCQLV